jgi:hypothetical protein
LVSRAKKNLAALVATIKKVGFGCLKTIQKPKWLERIKADRPLMRNLNGQTLSLFNRGCHILQTKMKNNTPTWPQKHQIAIKYAKMVIKYQMTKKYAKIFNPGKT